MKTKAAFFVFLLVILVPSQGLFLSYSPVNMFTTQAKTKQEFPAHPISQEIRFVEHQNTFSMQKVKKEHYTLRLMVQAKTNMHVDRLQDLTLLFINGTLTDFFVNNVQKKDTLETTHELGGSQSVKYEVITYHYAEHNQNGEEVSQNAISYDQVYLLSSALSTPSLFREPTTNTQKQWQRILDHAIKQQKKYEQKQLLEKFKLNEHDYLIYTLDELAVYTNDHLPTFSAHQTKEVLGQIWKHLYMHYVLGHVQDKRYPIDTRGSHMPLVAIARDHSHFHLLFRTRGGDEHKITQPLMSQLRTHAADIR
ncbi:hypothetical protein J2S00_003174 [Caldalkalibacillus uzonensis]|uniref:Uncharacterized protein n=1 Tax=Caldalkalibacillus uzonensis TaxID=353224 RepID=A0ABU0CXE2_9BACI|nr:hypothetical protein [Caldalkalibacillus uzonensis]MDQ0340365.1 hypothetical protein [Caldalkalibacillus uzonensis]